jgi:hypothetical protein
MTIGATAGVSARASGAAPVAVAEYREHEATAAKNSTATKRSREDSSIEGEQGRTLSHDRGGAKVAVALTESEKRRDTPAVLGLLARVNIGDPLRRAER